MNQKMQYPPVRNAEDRRLLKAIKKGQKVEGNSYIPAEYMAHVLPDIRYKLQRDEVYVPVKDVMYIAEETRDLHVDAGDVDLTNIFLLYFTKLTKGYHLPRDAIIPKNQHLVTHLMHCTRYATLYEDGEVWVRCSDVLCTWKRTTWSRTYEGPSDLIAVLRADLMNHGFFLKNVKMENKVDKQVMTVLLGLDYDPIRAKLVDKEPYIHEDSLGDFSDLYDAFALKQTYKDSFNRFKMHTAVAHAIVNKLAPHMREELLQQEHHQFITALDQTTLRVHRDDKNERWVAMMDWFMLSMEIAHRCDGDLVRTSLPSDFALTFIEKAPEHFGSVTINVAKNILNCPNVTVTNTRQKEMSEISRYIAKQQKKRGFFDVL